MLRDSQGRNLWIMGELGGHAPVRSFADILGRQRGRGRPDWWVVAKSPDWTPPGQPEGPKSLLSLGMDAGAGAGHTKIGVGRKPQGYDERGRYTGPNGGAADLRDGRVRLYEAEAGEEPGEPDADEPEAGDQEQHGEDAAPELEGVLVADSGRVVTDAEGGLSGGYEVRGPVTPPPAEVTWKNDDPNKPDPRKDDLSPKAQKIMEEMKTEVPKLESVNTNSGRRPYDPAKPNDPHTQGRAVDINNINGVRVKDLQSGSGEKAEQAREAAANLEDWAKTNPDVTQVIGPTGRWERNGDGDMDKRVPVEPKDFKTLEEHKSHYHFTIRW